MCTESFDWIYLVNFYKQFTPLEFKGKKLDFLKFFMNLCKLEYGITEVFNDYSPY